MNTFKNNAVFFYSFSIILHALLILMGFFLDWQRKTPDLGDTKEWIQSYVYRASSEKNMRLEKSSETKVSHTKPTRSLLLHRSLKNKQTKSSALNHHTRQQTENLLTILHTAIQNQQQYPISAMELGR